MDHGHALDNAKVPRPAAGLKRVLAFDTTVKTGPSAAGLEIAYDYDRHGRRHKQLNALDSRQIGNHLHALLRSALGADDGNTQYT